MIGKLRIGLGVLLIVGAAVVGLVGWGRSAPPPPVADSGSTVTRAAQAAANALSMELEFLRSRAKMAAGLEPLRAALTSRVDVPTLVDLFATEDWWRPFRDEVMASRLVVGDAVAHHGPVDLGTADQSVVAAARRNQLAGEVVAVNGRPLIIAASRVDLNIKGDPVIVVAMPLELKTLETVSTRTQLSLALTDGRSSLLVAGADAHRDFLEGLVRRTDTASVVDGTNGREAARIPMSKTISLWAARATAAPQLPRSNRGVFLGGAGALGVAGLALLLLRAPRRVLAQNFAPAYAVEPEPTLPFGSTGNHPRVTAPRVGTVMTSVSAPVRAVGGTRVGTSRERRAPATLPPPMPPPRPDPEADLPTDLPDTQVDASADLPVTVVPVTEEGSKLFGRYRILERLGSGGMSEVYTAVAHGAEGFSRTFVIKRLKPELAHTKDAINQFIDEARVQASLAHSNIVQVFDFGMMGGEYFMIEEYILGRDLARVSGRCVERTGFRLDPRLVFYMAYEALQALGYSHGKRGREGEPLGIVHRDVSASNIMLSSAGEVKLFDFGIAKANRRQSQTQAGMVKGNANFMSPEQARGQVVDKRSDLYSLGLVMYFCLTNQLLYTGENDLDILYRAACGPNQDDLDAIARVGPPAAEILMRALAVDPAARFQNADQFAAALAPHATGMQAEAASLMELLFGDEMRREAA
jgi:hypothetical protein